MLQCVAERRTVVVMGYWNGMGGWGTGLMMLFGVLLLAGLVVLVVVLVRGMGGGSRQDQGTPPGYGPPAGPGPELGGVRARQILAERYARGEIDSEEYQARLRALGES